MWLQGECTEGLKVFSCVYKMHLDSRLCHSLSDLRKVITSPVRLCQVVIIIPVPPSLTFGLGFIEAFYVKCSAQGLAELLILIWYQGYHSLTRLWDCFCGKEEVPWLETGKGQLGLGKVGIKKPEQTAPPNLPGTPLEWSTQGLWTLKSKSCVFEPQNLIVG